jgi:hypothetical protein
LIPPPRLAFVVSGNLSGCRPDALMLYSFRLQKSTGFCHPASIPTRSSFLACHNRSQISGVLDRQMTLYGIADMRDRTLGWNVRRCDNDVFV